MNFFQKQVNISELLIAQVNFLHSPENIEAPAANHTLATNAPSVDFILQKAFDSDPELQRMWFWLGGHGAQTIENVFEHSALYRKTKGPHYVALTIRNGGKRWNGNYYGKRFG